MKTYIINLLARRSKSQCIRSNDKWKLNNQNKMNTMKSKRFKLKVQKILEGIKIKIRNITVMLIKENVK